MSVKRYVMAAAMGEAVAFPQGDGTAADAWVGSIAAEETATEFVLASDYAALQSQNAELVTALKGAYHELGGIGAEASLQFHRIGIDSARGIIARALSKVSP